MKKFLLKLFMALLPFFVFLIMFIIFEPYNYFGFKEDAKLYATPLARVREFMRNPSENIILGDSRMNHFSLDYVEELTGKRYASLVTGGQAINLTREMYEWAANQVEVDNLLMDVSFYQIRKGNRSESAQPVFYIAEHPLEYMTTRDYVIEAFQEICNYFLINIGNDEAKTEEIREEELKIEKTIENDTKYRDDLLEYTLTNIYPMCENYSVSEDVMKDIHYMIEQVKSDEGNVQIFVPPVQEVIWEYVIEPLKLEPYLKEYKKELSNYVPIYDMEWKSEFSKNQNYYKDGFHYNEEAYRIITRNIFDQGADSIRIMSNVE